MKIGRYKDTTGNERLGIVIGEDSSLRVLDLQSASESRGIEAPTTMKAFIAGADRARDEAYATLEWAQREGQQSWFADERKVSWMLPVEVRSCIAGGRNFKAHQAETLEYWTKQGAKLHSEIPMGFIKLNSSLVPTRTDVKRPPETKWFDFEVEATAVIGWSAERVTPEKALKAVFGYTLLNDLSARELQRKEMANQAILLGKNFPGLGPLGPWIVTADELPDPAVIDITLTVNDQPRQHAHCADMIFTFAELVSHWSLLGLECGDLVTTGSPEGVAIGRPDPESFYLQPGDVVRAASPQIGVLETKIV